MTNQINSSYLNSSLNKPSCPNDSNTFERVLDDSSENLNSIKN